MQQSPLPHQRFWRWFRAQSVRLQIISCVVLILSCVLCTGISALAGAGNQVNPVAVASPTSASTGAPTVAPTPTPAPTTTPTAVPTTAPSHWVIVKTFSGSLSGGNWYYSPYFTVPDNWQVSWQSPNRESAPYSLVNIVASDHSGNPIKGDDFSVARGSASDTSGVGPMQKHGGTIRLQVYAQGDWTVTVSKNG